MADGEATQQQIAELRPHLRNCAGCRAAVRELRESGERLAALFPPVALVASQAPWDSAVQAALRLAESLWTTVQERAVGSVVRTQALVEAATTSKAAAVAASAAAAAGGRLAINDMARRPDADKRPQRTQHAARSHPPKAASARTTRPASAKSLIARPTRRTAPRATVRRAPEAPAARRPPPRRHPQAPEPLLAGEDPVVAAASAGSAPPGARSAAATAQVSPPSPPPPPGSGSATSDAEFGFESP